MADLIFENPKLAAVYDFFDGSRDDLTHYLSIAKELKAQTILDIGCGTGSFATLLIKYGFDVTGVDPAKASLDIAKSKQLAYKVKWIHGKVTDVPFNKFDLAFMTGNVAQVFITDEEWNETLVATRKALNPGGVFIFEVRDPSKRAWLEWTKDKTYNQIEIPRLGKVTEWCEVTGICGDLVSFRWTYTFESSGETLISDSTLIFRQKDEIISSLNESDFFLEEVRDAPDRPGKEWVFVARKVK